MVAARGLSWRPGRLPAGDRLLSFEVGYSWQACGAKGCVAGADSHAGARRVLHGHAATRAPSGERADIRPRRADEADVRLARAAPARTDPVPRLLLVPA